MRAAFGRTTRKLTLALGLAAAAPMLSGCVSYEETERPRVVTAPSGPLSGGPIVRYSGPDNSRCHIYFEGRYRPCPW